MQMGPELSSPASGSVASAPAASPPRVPRPTSQQPRRLPRRIDGNVWRLRGPLPLTRSQRSLGAVREPSQAPGAAPGVRSFRSVLRAVATPSNTCNRGSAAQRTVWLLAWRAGRCPLPTPESAGAPDGAFRRSNAAASPRATGASRRPASRPCHITARACERGAGYHAGLRPTRISRIVVAGEPLRALNGRAAGEPADEPDRDAGRGHPRGRHGRSGEAMLIGASLHRPSSPSSSGEAIFMRMITSS